MDYHISLSEPVFGSISGHAYFNNCEIPIARVSIQLEDRFTLTDSSGFFTMPDIPVGSYTLQATKQEFGPVNQEINVRQSVNSTLTVSMLSINYSSKIYGIVKSQDSLPIAGASVCLLNPDHSESQIRSTSNSVGFYQLLYVPQGYREISVDKDATSEYGYTDYSSYLNINGMEFPFDIEMNKYSLVGQFVDIRDNHTYQYKIIGTQTWMSENLAFLPAVHQVTNGSVIADRYYVFGNDSTNVDVAKESENYNIYGVLYNWTAANKACPYHWHLPNDQEWNTLATNLGQGAGNAMKSISGWFNNGNGSNSSGFNALPAGMRSDTGYLELTQRSFFWTSSIHSIGGIYWFLSYDDYVLGRSADKKSNAFSVRCIKD